MKCYQAIRLLKLLPITCPSLPVYLKKVESNGCITPWRPLGYYACTVSASALVYLHSLKHPPNCETLFPVCSRRCTAFHHVMLHWCMALHLARYAIFPMLLHLRSPLYTPSPTFNPLHSLCCIPYACYIGRQYEPTPPQTFPVLIGSFRHYSIPGAIHQATSPCFSGIFPYIPCILFVVFSMAHALNNLYWDAIRTDTSTKLLTTN